MITKELWLITKELSGDMFENNPLENWSLDFQGGVSSSRPEAGEPKKTKIVRGDPYDEGVV